jgi:hypothetical protein
MGNGNQRKWQENGFDSFRISPDSSESQKTMVHLLRHQTPLLAMKHRRAPLYVSPALCNGLVRLGAANDLYDLGSIARRLSFLGDGRVFLAELKVRTPVRPSVKVPEAKHVELGTGNHTEFEHERRQQGDQ